MIRKLLIIACLFVWLPEYGLTQPATTTTTTYDYDFSPGSNMEPMEVTVVSSDGSKRHTELGYGNPLDISNVTQMIVREVPGGPALSCEEIVYSWFTFTALTVNMGCASEAVEIGRFTTYDSNLRPTQFRLASGLWTDITYDGLNITSITRRFMAEGEISETLLTQTFTYDNRGRLRTATDENGTQHRYSYDGLGRLTLVERKAPTEILWQPLQEIEYYLSAQTTGQYNPNRPNYIRTTTYQTATVKDVATVYFDGLGREIQIQQTIEEGSLAVSDSVAVSFQEYDALGRPWRQWLPVGMRLPANGGFIPIAALRDSTRAYYADHPGNGTGPNNRPYSETTYEASPLSRPITEQAPGAPASVGGSGSVVTYTYGVAVPGPDTLAMTFTELRDEDDRFTRTYTDGLGRERFSIRGQGATEEARTGFVYDAADRLLVVRPPNYYAGDLDILRHLWETVYTVDTRGLVLTKTTPDTRNTAGSGPGTFRYAYDTSGRLRYSQDPEQRALGHVAYIRYDAMDRPVYSGVGRPLPCAPGTGNPEACWNQLNPDSHDPIIRDVLDPSGNAHWEWLGANRRTQYAYDAQAVGGWPFSGDTLAGRNYTAGRPAAIAHRIEGMWDVGTVRWQTTQFSYDAQGLVADRRERIRIGSSTPWDLFTYTYNRAGMLTADRVTVGTHTLRHQYGYDRRGLLTTVGISHATTDAFSQILALDYAIDGAVTERHLGTGTGQTSVPYAYDVAGRIHEIGDVDRFLNPDPFAARYSYAPSGLISQIETRSGAAAQQCPYGGAACSVRWHYAFSYDGLARLADAMYDSVPSGGRGSAYRVHNITYDPQGNLLTLNRYAPTSGSPSGTLVDQLSYNYTPRTNRLASVADGATTDLDWDAKPTDFVYNRVGSMTRMIETLSGSITRTTAVQRYDERQLPENLTITHAQGGTIISTQQVRYRYDVNGQRISKNIPSGAHSGFERYVRDGMRLIGVFDENDNLKNWNLGGIAGLVGRADSDPMAFEPIPRYYVTDHLGSIRAVVDQSGTVIEGRDYYPYGLTMPGRFYVQADTTREGFTGHELDKETGDYYAGARYYSPALGRWFVVDPLAEMYPGSSPFGYVLGNPVMLIDPDGRKWETYEDFLIAFEIQGAMYDRINELDQENSILQTRLGLASRTGSSSITKVLSNMIGDNNAMINELRGGISEVSALGASQDLMISFTQKGATYGGPYSINQTQIIDSVEYISVDYSHPDIGGHELRHLFQYAIQDGGIARNLGLMYFHNETQRLTYSPGMADVYEIPAYRLQYSINRSSVPMSPGSINAITRSWLKSLPGNPYGIHDN